MKTLQKICVPALCMLSLIFGRAKATSQNTSASETSGCPLSGCAYTGSVTLPALNRVIYADQMSGSTADVKISNAITALGTSGGVVDVTGFGATTQTIAATVNVPANVWIRGNGRVTDFQPSSASVTPMFSINSPTASMTGIMADLTGLSANTWTGCVFTISGNFNFGKSGIYQATLSDFSISAGNQNSGSGVCMSSTSDITNPVAGLSIRHFFIVGTQNGISLSATGSSGWVNGNTFADGWINQSSGTNSCGVLLHSTQNSPGGIWGNSFTQMDYEANGISTNHAVCMTGSGTVIGTLWQGGMWDVVTPVHYDCSPSCSSTHYVYNDFKGFIDGKWERGAPAYDNYESLFQNTQNFAGVWTANNFNSTLGSYSFNGAPVLVENGSNNTGIQPQAHGGLVSVQDPTSGYAPLAASQFNVGPNLVIPSTTVGYTGAGTKISMPTQGTVVLAAGKATVRTSAACTVGATCFYQLTNCGTGGTVGMLSVGTISAGTSFEINSSSATDTSTVCWQVN